MCYIFDSEAFNGVKAVSNKLLCPFDFKNYKNDLSLNNIDPDLHYYNSFFNNMLFIIVNTISKQPRWLRATNSQWIYKNRQSQSKVGPPPLSPISQTTFQYLI